MGSVKSTGSGADSAGCCCFCPYSPAVAAWHPAAGPSCNPSPPALFTESGLGSVEVLKAFWCPPALSDGLQL